MELIRRVSPRKKGTQTSAVITSIAPPHASHGPGEKSNELPKNDGEDTTSVPGMVSDVEAVRIGMRTPSQ